ncbi:PREDICTED: ankyrin-1-like [Amphimedon queenslandica]|nr:PREDICTED: ankyrin-1-like [Amphimedon queenslandica]|eukprot:XP_019854775.1 PREDICTED: ankyrin-1-like [Amphimedon queenslandica]
MSLLVEYGADVHKFVGTYYSPIHCAARCGHVEAIEFLLKKGVSIDHCNESIRGTPLMVANIFQKTKSCSYLIQHGATLDFQNNDGQSALALVCEMGFYSMAKLLLEGGANPNLQSNYGSTPLSISCYEGHQKIVKLLLDFNADPNIQMIQFNGLTPLMLACYHENHNIVKLLLQAGVYVDAQSDHNWGRITALHIASIRNDTQLVRLLLNANADVNVQTTEGLTPMYIACVQGNKEMLQFFIEKKADPNLGDKYGKSPLYAAIERNSVEIVTALLDTGADPNIAGGKFKVTPLQYACTCSSDDIIHLLLKANASPNAPSTEGYTPLSIASVTGRIKVVEMLLSEGANVELEDTDGWTPIFHAAAGGRLDVIRLLLKHGAKIKKDKFGKTIESIAAKSKRIKIKDLLQEATKQKDEVTVNREEERKDEPSADEEVLRTALTTPVEVDTESSGKTTKPSPLINEDNQQSTDNSYSRHQNFLSFISSNIGSIKQQYDNTIKRLEHQMEAMQSRIAKQQKFFL